jgi:uncharacterized protein (TIGR03000 family)
MFLRGDSESFIGLLEDGFMVNKKRVFRVALLAILLLMLVHSGSGQTAQSSRPVLLRVLLPAATAQLRIEDQPTQQTGATRLFSSPPLAIGSTYRYRLAASWAPNNYTTITRTREISVQAGQDVTVDMRRGDKDRPDKIVIRYVPTPQEVVDAMLKLAAVGKGDVVYDLGCGDGRIVVTAVRDFGAKRGVGVDIDPKRIQESRANAKRSNVEGKVEFRQGDVFAIRDLSEATVVTLYMGQELNLALRPILQKALKPGARIVSHRFTMGDWKPLETRTLTDAEGEKYLIHLWKIGEGESKK